MFVTELIWDSSANNDGTLAPGKSFADYNGVFFRSSGDPQPKPDLLSIEPINFLRSTVGRISITSNTTFEFKGGVNRPNQIWGAKSRAGINAPTITLTTGTYYRWYVGVSDPNIGNVTSITGWSPTQPSAPEATIGQNRYLYSVPVVLDSQGNLEQPTTASLVRTETAGLDSSKDITFPTAYASTSNISACAWRGTTAFPTLVIWVWDQTGNTFHAYNLDGTRNSSMELPSSFTLPTNSTGIGFWAQESGSTIRFYYIQSQSISGGTNTITISWFNLNGETGSTTVSGPSITSSGSGFNSRTHDYLSSGAGDTGFWRRTRSPWNVNRRISALSLRLINSSGSSSHSTTVRFSSAGSISFGAEQPFSQSAVEGNDGSNDFIAFASTPNLEIYRATGEGSSSRPDVLGSINVGSNFTPIDIVAPKNGYVYLLTRDKLVRANLWLPAES